MQATAIDTAPISGLTATCVGAGSSQVIMQASGRKGQGCPQHSASVAPQPTHLRPPLLQLFPGQGAPDGSANFTSGLTNATVLYGQFMESFVGVGGAGPNSVSKPGAVWAWPGRR